MWSKGPREAGSAAMSATNAFDRLPGRTTSAMAMALGEWSIPIMVEEGKSWRSTRANAPTPT
jgi:hypothetical protein